MSVRKTKTAGNAGGARMFVPTPRHLWLAALGLLAATRRAVPGLRRR